MLSGRIFPIVFLVMTSVVSGCGSSDDSDSASGTPSSEEELEPFDEYTTFEVEWSDDAVVVEDLDSVQEHLTAANYQTGEFSFDSTFSGTEDLQVGSVTLLAGIGVFEVTGRSETEEGVTFETVPALLTDVIENGTIEWGRDLLLREERQALGIDGDARDNIRQVTQELGTFDGETLEYTGQVNNFNTSFRLSPQGQGLSVSLSATYEQGDQSVNLGVTGTLKALRHTAQIIIEDGSLSVFDARLIQVKGDVTLAASASSAATSDHTLEVPAKMTFPVVIGGIPFRLDLGGALELQSTLGVSSSISFEGKTTFDGAVGVRVADGETRYLAEFESSSVAVNDASAQSNITAGVGLMVRFPEVSLGLGVPAVANVSGGFRYKSELVSNVAVDPFNDRTCLEAGTNVGATLVGEVSFLGLTLAEEEITLYSDLGEDIRSAGCDDF